MDKLWVPPKDQKLYAMRWRLEAQPGAYPIDQQDPKDGVCISDGVITGAVRFNEDGRAVVQWIGIDGRPKVSTRKDGAVNVTLSVEALFDAWVQLAAEIVARKKELNPSLTMVMVAAVAPLMPVIRKFAQKERARGQQDHSGG